MSNTIYCTYLTVYSGNKLPPLYIGSTSVNRINKGYHGSVVSKKYKEIWKSELKENPELFETKILTTHSTREEALEEEIRYQIENDVVKSAEYINMAIANKKFIFFDYDDSEYRKKMSESAKKRWENPEERKKTSKSLKGRSISEESKKKQSESIKKRYENPEHKKKMSVAQKKRYENPEERKKISESMKGIKRGPYKKKL